MNPVADTITRTIRAKGRGWVFTPKDFLRVGSRATVDQTLSRLSRKGMIRRLSSGLYDYPKQHPQLGMLSPSADDLAQAITAKKGDRVFPSGAAAANSLGLSTQVPAKPVYLTNGPSKTYKIGTRTISLKHARIPIFNRLSDQANLVIQALAYMGKDNIDVHTVQLCAKFLSDKDVKKMLTVIPQLPDWLTAIVMEIQKIKNG